MTRIEGYFFLYFGPSSKRAGEASGMITAGLARGSCLLYNAGVL